MAQSNSKITKEELMFLKGCIKKAKESLLEEKDSIRQAREFKKYADDYIERLMDSRNED